MYTQVTQSDFIDAFRTMNRMDNFSYDGLVALYEWFEQYEEDTGERIELDVIAICCDFSEMRYNELRSEYYNEVDYGDITEEEMLTNLLDNTIVIYSDDDKVLFQSF